MAGKSPTLAALLDVLIPARDDGGLPGAGSLGLAEPVHAALAPALEPLLAQALETLDHAARERGAADFAAASPALRGEILARLAEPHPALVQTLAFLSYRAYYSDPRVLEALGLEPRSPFPEGHPMEPTDFRELLAPVRRRAKLYRDAP